MTNQPEHRYHLTRLSANMKLGGIPASVTSHSSCPARCSLKSNGCYSEAGPLAWHWRRVSSGERGTDLEEFCAQVKSLPKFSLWRHNQAGDLPGDQVLISREDLRSIVRANRGRLGFTFSHYDPALPPNAAAIKEANENGFTINLSAETLAEADEFLALGIAPVVVILPINQTAALKTPAGNIVMVCPASISNTTCSLCGICAKPDRKFVVGFPSHGTGKAKAQKVFFAAKAA